MYIADCEGDETAFQGDLHIQCVSMSLFYCRWVDVLGLFVQILVILVLIYFNLKKKFYIDLPFTYVWEIVS